jgi:hypothetical protein
MNNRYERVYDVGLLDDLHNYFPGLLYEQERFRTVPDVLSYIRQNTSRRFNLFDYGARQYQQTNVPRNTFVHPPQQNMHSTPVVNRWTPPTQPVPQPQAVEVDITDAMDLSILFPLLRSLDILTGTQVQPPPTLQRVNRGNRFAGLFQDVIINASQDLIDNASTLRTLLMDLEESCSICQDRMRQGENIRRLNTCHHEFHGECVDNWFLTRSVLCPVCRHDIRNRTPATRSPLLRAAPSVPQVNEDALPPLDESQLRRRNE